VNVVRKRTGVVDARECHQFVQVCTVYVQDILLLLRVPGNLLVVDKLVLDLAEVNTTHTTHACQDRVEDLVFPEAESRRVLHCISVKCQTQNDLVR
jgi:hypothetical protein